VAASESMQRNGVSKADVTERDWPNEVCVPGVRPSRLSRVWRHLVSQNELSIKYSSALVVPQCVIA
jgi:hypothetical protein